MGKCHVLPHCYGLVSKNKVPLIERIVNTQPYMTKQPITTHTYGLLLLTAKHACTEYIQTSGFSKYRYVEIDI